MRLGRFTVVLCAAMVSVALVSVPTHAQLTAVEAQAATMSNDYHVMPNIVYLTANNYQDKLDVYQPAGDHPHPTLIYIHGGGWYKGRNIFRDHAFSSEGLGCGECGVPLARVSLAPTAVEDCRCALRWVTENTAQYKFDTDRIVVTGHSAGGHLSLTTGMLPGSAGLETSHSINLSDLHLRPADSYEVKDVFAPDSTASKPTQGILSVEAQPPHSVRLLKLIDASVPPTSPQLSVDVPKAAQLSTEVEMVAKEVGEDSSPAVSYHWNFGDGTSANGRKVTHAYTRQGQFSVHLTAAGLDSIATEKTFPITVSGQFSTRFAPARKRRFDH